MKVLVLAFFVLGLACATIGAGYHKAIGIPTAERIRQAETSPLRIIKGSYAHLGSYPYFGGLLIALDIDVVSVCGSTLITNTRLVTAAHCWNDGEDEALLVQVVLASTTLFGGGRRINTNKVTVHEKYNPETARNDIAIITVPAIELNDYIRPIKLPEDTSSRFVDMSGQLVGFGMTSDTSPIEISQRLSYTNITIRPDWYCELYYGSAFTPSMICTEGTHSGPCMGDSGGPLVYKNNNFEDVLIGVVSYGSDSGCTAGHPSVYTRITSYIDWIQSKI